MNGCELRELKLRDPFGIARGTKRSVRNLFLRIGEGWGEGAVVDYKGQKSEEMLEIANEWLADEPDLSKSIAETIYAFLERYPNQSGVAQAIDLALHDAWGKAEGKPLDQLWGLPREKAPLSSFTIGMDTLDVVMEKTRRAERYPILKVKVGGENDLHVLQAISEETSKPLYIDANEGWSLEQALDFLPRLRDFGVQLIEQPLPRADLEGYEQLREKNNSGIPIIIDEGVQGPDDVAQWQGRADGINIKLAKCGGLSRARETIEQARHHNLKVMIGCMTESSLGITTAAHLRSLVDFADLDGAELISNDPFVGMRMEQGRMVMPEGDGIGVIWRE